MKRKRRGVDGFMALKLDMSKVHDRVKWPYLRVVLIQIGFDKKWVKLIMTCVVSVS